MVNLTILSSNNEPTSENNKGDNIESEKEIQNSAPSFSLTKLTPEPQNDLFEKNTVIKLVYQKVLRSRTSGKTVPGASILHSIKRKNCDIDDDEPFFSLVSSKSNSFSFSSATLNNNKISDIVNPKINEVDDTNKVPEIISVITPLEANMNLETTSIENPLVELPTSLVST